jgi:TolB-like protein/DNA-binding winged helix-turn-helix (wHTH) protein
MSPPPAAPSQARFGPFQVDRDSEELYKQGVRIRLQHQPFHILLMLLEHPGRMVTREELRQALWPRDTFVDFDQGLNKAINKLRESLSDSAEHPTFIETLPKRGYRFIAPVEAGPPMRWRQWAWLVLAAIVASLALWVIHDSVGLRHQALMPLGAHVAVHPPPRFDSIAVLPLENLSLDPEQEHVADAVTEALITELGKIRGLRVISRTSVMRYKHTNEPLPEIARELKVGAIVEGTVQRSGNRVRVTIHLLEAGTDNQIWAEGYEREMPEIFTLERDAARDMTREVRSIVAQ